MKRCLIGTKMGQLWSNFEEDRVALPSQFKGYDCQSKEVPGEIATRVSLLNKGDELCTGIDPSVTTLYENFLKGVKVPSVFYFTN